MDVTPEKRLFAAVMLKAYSDYRLAKKGRKSEQYNLEELEDFFNSKYCDEILDLLKLNKEAVRKKLENIK